MRLPGSKPSPAKTPGRHRAFTRRNSCSLIPPLHHSAIWSRSAFHLRYGTAFRRGSVEIEQPFAGSRRPSRRRHRCDARVLTAQFRRAACSRQDTVEDGQGVRAQSFCGSRTTGTWYAISSPGRSPALTVRRLMPDCFGSAQACAPQRTRRNQAKEFSASRNTSSVTSPATTSVALFGTYRVSYRLRASFLYVDKVVHPADHRAAIGGP
jgi:hypothetical protein